MDRGETQTVDAVAWPNDDHAALYRAGGLAGLTLGACYVVITVLYLLAGAVPSDAQGVAWLAYLDGKTGLWWGITSLSVVTDLLFFPIVAALHAALGRIQRIATLAGLGLLVLFVILDLAVTWPNYAALITLAGEAADATDAGRAAAIGAATYAAMVLDSSLFAVYAILIPAVGIMLIGFVMLRGGFGRAAGWLGVGIGIFGLVAVLGGLVVAALGTLAILTSVLTAAWVVIVGFRLLILGRARSGG